MTPFPELGLSFGLALILGLPVLAALRRLRAGQVIRHQGPVSHAGKAGTPTMGGILFVVSTGVAILLFDRNATALLALATMVAFAAIGAADDLLKIRRSASLGLRARDKMLAGTVIALILGTLAAHWLGSGLGTGVLVPLTGRLWLTGPLFLPLVWLTVIGTTSAVNESDGLDGLAAGLGVAACVSLSQVTLHTGPIALSPFCLALAGGLLAFLVYNLHPAKLFMGDTGSLALGGALAAVAVLSGSELFLLPIGGVFVIETLSVVAQVTSFRLTGRRILKMSPLHHHFELVGWNETTVTWAFWGAGTICAIIGAAVLR